MILFRYMAREVLVTMLAVTAALLVIIMSSRLIKYLAEVAEGNMAADLLFMIMLYRLPNFLEVIVPLGFFIGILLAYGRLYVDSEMTVMSACGLSRERLIVYTLIPAFAVAAVVGGMSLVLSPGGIAAYKRLLQDSKSADALKLAVEARFRADRGGSVSYIGTVENDGSMRDIFVANPMRGPKDRDLLVVTSAESGRLVNDTATGQYYLSLDSGTRYIGEAGEVDYEIVSFQRYGQWLLNRSAPDYRREIDGASTADLFGSADPEATATLQWRISLALLVPIVALIAVALSETDHRRGRFGKLFPAFILYMLYLVGLNAARDAVAKGNLAPVPGLWGVHGIFLLIGLVLLYWEPFRRHWKHRGREHAPA